MKKLIMMMAVMGAITTTTFAHDNDKGKSKKDEKCMAGKDCCKKMSTASAAAKAKCAKMCQEKKS